MYFDSTIDIKVEPESNKFFTLNEIVGDKGLFESPEDLIFIGSSPSTDPESVRLLQKKGIKILNSDVCNSHEWSLVTQLIRSRLKHDN